ncbi:ornithine cyclodeaminase family protein [Anoxybacterium hadale]|uniref:Ornithine cyclodeaminase family protein n=1 Tax=Anoxybacterium hadale TaxID=3408580 RepID=A0ACD1ACN9_9FIRM|nr:ornithine cyclodeaminase family protein [Clostridiales bacterium]
MKIIVLNQSEINRIFSMEEAIQADKDALKLYSLGKSNVPLRYNLDVPQHEGQSLYMPGYVADANALGIKIVSVFPKNIEKGLTSVPATMVLVNSETGEVCSLIDGTYLTRLRTGAVSGAATDILAKKDSKVFALFGTGGQAESQLEAVLTVRPVELVKVYDISPERAKDFAERMTVLFGEKFSVTITAAASAEEAVADADIITCVTTSSKPVFDGRLAKKGCHINGVGSYTPAMNEIDEYLITHADKVYVDTRNGVLNESGDLIVPIQNGTFRAEQITGELGEVIAQKVEGRLNDDEITVFKTTGTAVMDVVTGQRIYEAALEKGAGSIIEF